MSAKKAQNNNMQPVKSPRWEAVKEVARWVVLFVASWIITQVLSQITKVPETTNVNVWVFTFVVPVRLTIQTILTLAGRWIDKYLFIKDQNKTYRLDGTEPKGLLPF